MRSDRNMRQQHTFLFITLLTIVLAFLLAGCGANNNTYGAGTGPNQPSAPPSTTQKGYGAAFGCPSNAVVSTAPTKANVIIQQSNVNSTVTAHTGNIIEVRLPFGHKWSGPMNHPSILTMQQPAGYAWKDDQVCVWRFLATTTGTAQLTFNSQQICKPNEMCAQFILNVPFTIKVV